MLPIILLLLAGLLLLTLGGEGLVAGAARLAYRAGLPPLVVGLTIVAFGTSTPELLVSVQSALAGVQDIAVGNVVGSNVCNVLLILGLASLVRPLAVHTRVLKIDAPLVVLVSLALLGAFHDERISRTEGFLLLAGLLVFTALNLRLARREPSAEQGETPPVRSSVWVDLALIAGGLLGLTLGAHLFVEGAVDLASRLGASEALIGLTVVAVGTSLPELATSVVAARRGQGDIAIGNVLGSNVFNVLGILGATSIVTPLLRGGVGWNDLLVMLGAALLLLPLVVTGRRLVRGEGALLLLAYAGYVAWRASAPG